MTDFRQVYGLPARYFLSLGRMVEKKNLATLVAAYAKFCDGWREPESAKIGRRSDQPGDELRVKNGEEHRVGGIKHGAGETAGAKDAAATAAEYCKLNTEHCAPALVFVGSGELEGALREQASALGLRVIDRSNWKAGETSETRDSLPVTRDEENCGAVFFYGFRQLEENPVFYALAEAFILPSLYEEWGLVVNEAMACSLPVIVSRTAGCAEDLLPGSESFQCSVGSVQLERDQGRDERPRSSVSQAADDPADRPYPEELRGGVQPDASESTRHSPLVTRHALEERPNGFVFDPTSVEALAEALRRIASVAPVSSPAGHTIDGEDAAATNISAMGLRSREIVEQFSCDNFARQALAAARAAQRA